MQERACASKLLGYAHIPGTCVQFLNRFTTEHLIRYVNYHCPCLFVQEQIDERSWLRKRYRYQDVSTLYAKLKSLPAPQNCLRPWVDFGSWAAKSRELSANEAAERMREARREWLHLIDKQIRNYE